ncbi:MAG TPA: ribokinase [Stellaceae bacterium]|nr:ribokinase [Stellaceae bacterium]
MSMRSACAPRGPWPDVILVFGSINIDLAIAAPHLPAPGETVIGESYRLAPGGKGANQALAAKRAGARVVLVGAVGTDAFAEAALALLRADGVELALLESAEHATGCAAITVAASGENMITVAAGANRLARAAMVPDGLLGPETTLLLQMEVPPEEVALLAQRAKRRGCRVILNLAPATAPTEALLRQLDLLVVNEAEAQSLDRAPAALAAAFGLVVVETQGARGAVAFLPQGDAIAVPALPIEPVDTTGAGDCFVGVLAAGLSEGLPLLAALHRASIAAGLACRIAGAQPSLPTRSAIDAAAGKTR